MTLLDFSICLLPYGHTVTDAPPPGIPFNSRQEGKAVAHCICLLSDKVKPFSEDARRASLVVVVKNPPANAGDTGLSPGPGRSHMPQSNTACESQLLNPCTTTTEAHEPRALTLQREATAMRSLHTTTKGSPCSLQLEKAHAQQ